MAAAFVTFEGVSVASPTEMWLACTAHVTGIDVDGEYVVHGLSVRVSPTDTLGVIARAVTDALRAAASPVVIPNGTIILPSFTKG